MCDGMRLWISLFSDWPTSSFLFLFCCFLGAWILSSADFRGVGFICLFSSFDDDNLLNTEVRVAAVSRRLKMELQLVDLSTRSNTETLPVDLVVVLRVLGQMRSNAEVREIDWIC